MRISEAQTTAKKTLVMNDIAGVDLTSAPLGVDANRASYMKNMINKGGVNYKRNGFVQAAQFFDQNGQCQKINGIYPLSMGEHFAVHTGTELRKCNSDFSFVESMLEDGAELADKKSQGFYANGTLYLVCDERLYYYDAKKEDGKLLPLFNSDKAYVPTTSIGITDTEHGSLLEPFEEINIFSTRRKNKLIGVKNEVKEKITVDGIDAELYSPSLSQATYILDGLIDTSKKMIIKASFFIGGFSSSRNEELPCSTDKSSTNIRVETIFNVSSYGTECSGESTAIYKNGETLNIIDFQTELSFYNSEKRFNPTVIVDNKDGHGVITFTPALPSPVLGEDNITVEYSVAKEEPKIKCACEMTIAAYNKQLAIVTEDDMVYYSSPAHGWGYFPDKSYIKSINNVTAVFDGDGALVVTSRHESAVISFNIRESDGLVVVPRVNAIYSDIGSISPYASVNLEGDTLMLTRKGVFGIGPRGVYIRSSAINKELLKFSEKDFEQAVACEHDARYYLFIGGVVYIADARYKVKFHEGERLASSYEYEWWRWEVGAPTSCLCHNEKMYLGKSDGRVLQLGDGYVDVIEENLNSGEVSVVHDGGDFVFNAEYDIENATVILDNATRYITMSTPTVSKAYEEDDDRLRLNYSTDAFAETLQNNWIYKGMTLLIPMNETVLQTTVDKLDIDTECVIVKLEEGEIEDFDERVVGGLMTPCNDVRCFARNRGDCYELTDEKGMTIHLSEYESISVRLLFEKPVECEIHTAIFNLGSDIKKKVLHELCFVPGITTTGEVSIGFETNKNGDLQSVGVGGTIVSTPSVATELDIGGLDFNNLTFDSAFVRTFRKRLHERGVEFVKFKLASKTADDFSIERLSCVYSYYSR